MIHTATAQEGLEIMDINDALEKYDWLKDYYFKLVQPDADKYTAYSATHPVAGYFLRALPGAKITFPLQACLYMGREGMIQNVHNIIIAEEGSEFHIISGCTSDTHVTSGLHVGISEFYVKDNAKLTFTMVHNWAEDVARAAEISYRHGQERCVHEQLRVHDAGEGHPDVPRHRHGGREQCRPLQHDRLCLEGLALRPRLQGHPEGKRLQGRADRHGPSRKGGYIASRGLIQGDAAGIKAHLECRGLILGEGGIIYAVPELLGSIPGVDLSHEAAVGKIAEEEIQYLMARGVDADTATAFIVRGFLDVDVKGLPPQLQAEMKKTIELGEKL